MPPHSGDRSLCIFFEGGLEVDLSDSPSGGVLYKGMIGKCPQKNSEAFILKLMEANLFGRGTRGAAIGLREEDNLLTLFT